MTKADERIARIEDAIARLEQLVPATTGPTPSPGSVYPDGSPGLVAPGELIESAWGNAVSNTIADIRARRPQRYVIQSQANHVVINEQWTKMTVGNIVLPANFAWDLLVTVAANVQDLDAGQTDLCGGFDGTNWFGTSAAYSYGYADSDAASAVGPWITAAFAIDQIPPGTHTVDTFARSTVAGGKLRGASATVLAFPHFG